MTDRINALTIVLEDDYRDDDMQALMAAIKQFRGILSVVPHVRDISDLVARERAAHDIKRRIYEALEGL